tara:strand:+ start:156 stop:2489 length:2334 start_codon:yes stop_codon:yes gene_type:complete
MSTIKISELATSNIALTDFFAKADATGVANKNTVQELSNLLKTVDDTAFKGSIAIADVPSENGWYFASESGTYTNCGGLVVNTTDNIAIIIVSGTFDTFNKIDIPVNITIDAIPTEGSANAVQSGGVSEAIFNSAKYPLQYKANLTVGKNKFNTDTKTDGFRIDNTNGSLITDASRFTSDYIKVVAGGTYIVRSQGSNLFSCYFDENFNVVAGGYFNVDASIPFVIPSTVYYVRVSGVITGLPTYQLEEGSVWTNFKPYKLESSYDEIPFLKYTESTLYGSKIQNSLKKLSDVASSRYDKPFKVTILHDSIVEMWTYTGGFQFSDWVQWMKDTYGRLDIEFVRIGGSGYPIEQHLPLVYPEVIDPNVDLFIFAEYQDLSRYRLMMAESIIQEVRKKTTADIMFINWTVTSTAMNYWKAGDFTNYKLTDDYQRWLWFANMASKYNAELVDVQSAFLRALDNGVTVAELTSDGIHPTSLGYDYWSSELLKHFPTKDNISRVFNDNVNENNEYFIQAIENELFPKGISRVTKSGTWEYYREYGNLITDASIGTLFSQTNGSYLEFKFDGVGCDIYIRNEVLSQGSNLGVLIDGVAPSTLLLPKPLQYATQINEKVVANTKWYWHRLFNVFVESNILSNGEKEREFEITLTSLTRDGGGILTAGNYTVKDITNNVTMSETGDLFADSTFVVSSGLLKIPYKNLNIVNWIDTPPVEQMEINDTYKFFVRNNWIDVINEPNTDSLIDIHRVLGLDNKEHVLRLTKTDSNKSFIDGIMVFNPVK